MVETALVLLLLASTSCSARRQNSSESSDCVQVARVYELYFLFKKFTSTLVMFLAACLEIPLGLPNIEIFATFTCNLVDHTLEFTFLTIQAFSPSTFCEKIDSCIVSSWFSWHTLLLL